MTLYDILGINSSASSEEIKAAYKTLAKKHHPDKNQGSSWHEEQFKRINQAYQILSNTTKRKQYDYLLEYELFQRQNYNRKPPQNPYKRPAPKKDEPITRPVYTYAPRNPKYEKEERKINIFVVSYYVVLLLVLGLFFGYRDTIRAKSSFEAAMESEKKGAYYEALGFYTKALAFDEEYTEAYERRGTLWINAYKNYGKALDDYTRAINSTYTPSPSLLFKRAKCYYMLRLYKLAITDLDVLLTEKEEKIDSVFFYKAESNYHLQQYKLAIPDYTNFIKIKPLSEEAFLNRGYSYYMNKEYTNALSDYDFSISQKPEIAKNYYNRGFIKFALQDSTQGCIDLNDSFLLGYSEAAKDLKKYCHTHIQIN
jgi:curved DNA-binding protein CbpA